MTCIFSSFPVNQCAFTSCHVVISKQGSASRQSGPCDQNHTGIFRQSPENRESSEGHAADQRRRSSLTIRLARGCKR